MNADMVLHEGIQEAPRYCSTEGLFVDEKSEIQKSNALGDELEARLGELLTDLFDLGVVAGLQC